MDYVLVKVGPINNPKLKLGFNGSLFTFGKYLGEYNEEYVGIELVKEFNAENRIGVRKDSIDLFYAIPCDMLDSSVRDISPKTFNHLNRIYKSKELKVYRDSINLIESLFLNACYDVVTFYKYLHKVGNTEYLARSLYLNYHNLRPLCDDIISNGDITTLMMVYETIFSDVHVNYYSLRSALSSVKDSILSNRHQISDIEIVDSLVERIDNELNISDSLGMRVIYDRLANIDLKLTEIKEFLERMDLAIQLK